MSQETKSLDNHVSKPFGCNENQRHRFCRQDFKGNLPDSMNLSLTADDPEYGKYKIPLGKTKTYASTETLPEGKAGEHQLIGVQLGRFVLPNSEQLTGDYSNPEKVDILYHLLTDAPLEPMKPKAEAVSNSQDKEIEGEPKYIDSGLRPGWVYVFVEGHLWREFQINTDQTTVEVNLTQFKGQDKRPATIIGTRMIELPICIQSKSKQVEMAYSEFQWSWAYLNHFGGMAKDDPRLSQGPAAPENFHRLPKAKNQSGTALTLPTRQQRFQDFTQALSQWDTAPIQAYNPPKTTINPAPEDTAALSDYLQQTSHLQQAALKQLQEKDQQQGQQLFRYKDETYIPTLYLNDPVGIMKELISSTAQCKAVLLQVRQDAKQHPEYLMANLTRQLLAEEPKYQDYVDMNTLDDVLNTKAYTLTAKYYRAAVQLLAKFSTQAQMSNAQTGMALQSAVADFWQSQPQDYAEVQMLVGSLFSSLNNPFGQSTLIKLFEEKNLIVEGAFAPDKKQLKEIIKTTYEGSIELVKDLAGVASLNKTVFNTVNTYNQTLIKEGSHGNYQLSEANVTVGTLMAGLEAKNLASTTNIGRFDLPKRFPGTMEHFKEIVPKIGHSNEAERVSLKIWQLEASNAVNTSTHYSQNQSHYDLNVKSQAENEKIAWLHKNQQAVKLFGAGFLLVLDVFNLVGAISQVREKHSAISRMNATAASFKLISILTAIPKDIWAQRIPPIEAEMIGKTLPSGFKALLVATHASLFIGNSICVALDIHKSIKNFDRGNDSLSAINALTTMGDTMCTFASAMEELKEFSKYAIVRRLTSLPIIRVAMEKLSMRVMIGILGTEGIELISILSWVGLAITLISLVLEYLFTKTPLEKWLYHGPFGVQHAQRFLPPAQGGTEQWASWENPHQAQADLLNLLYSMQVQVTGNMESNPAHHRVQEVNSYTVNVMFPWVVPGKSVLYYSAKGSSDIKANDKVRYTPQRLNHLLQNDNGFKQLTFTFSNEYVSYEFEMVLDVYGDGTLLLPGYWDKSMQPKPLLRQFNAFQYQIIERIPD